MAKEGKRGEHAGKKPKNRASIGRISRADLAAIKEGLAKVRKLLDHYFDYLSGDVASQVTAESGMAAILAPYRELLKNPTLEAYRAFLQEEGFLGDVLAPYAPPAPEDTSLWADVIRAIYASSILSTVPAAFVGERVAPAYVTLYRTLRDDCLAALNTPRFPRVFATALMLGGPRVRVDNPLSQDPLLRKEEQLWLSDRTQIPRPLQQEARHQLQLIQGALLQGANPGGRPPQRTPTQKHAQGRTRAQRARDKTHAALVQLNAEIATAKHRVPFRLEGNALRRAWEQIENAVIADARQNKDPHRRNAAKQLKKKLERERFA